MNQNLSMSDPFKTGWYSFGPGSYRPCKVAYCPYPYDSIPQLPAAQNIGKLQWLELFDEDIDRIMQKYRYPEEEAFW